MLSQIFQVVIALFFICSFGINLNGAPPIFLADAKCRAPTNAKDATRAAGAVFIGTISKISDSAGDVKTFEFAVERYWKGEKTKIQNVRVYFSENYSPSFNIGERYIVYAAKDSNGELFTGRCTRTKLAQYADDDVRALGRGKKP